MVRADHSCGISDGDQILYGGVGGRLHRAGSPAASPSTTPATRPCSRTCSSSARCTAPSWPSCPSATSSPWTPARPPAPAAILGVRKVIPIHWGTFPVLTGTPEKLVKALGDHGITCEVIGLKPGESY